MLELINKCFCDACWKNTFMSRQLTSLFFIILGQLLTRSKLLAVFKTFVSLRTIHKRSFLSCFNTVIKHGLMFMFVVARQSWKVVLAQLQ